MNFERSSKQRPASSNPGKKLAKRKSLPSLNQWAGHRPRPDARQLQTKRRPAPGDPRGHARENRVRRPPRSLGQQPRPPNPRAQSPRLLLAHAENRLAKRNRRAPRNEPSAAVQGHAVARRETRPNEARKNRLANERPAERKNVAERIPAIGRIPGQVDRVAGESGREVDPRLVAPRLYRSRDLLASLPGCGILLGCHSFRILLSSFQTIVWLVSVILVVVRLVAFRQQAKS